jgi:hypothetical protein
VSQPLDTAAVTHRLFPLVCVRVGLPVATSFSSFYGKLNIVPFLGDNINLLMPILIIIIAVLHGFNVLNTLLQVSTTSLWSKPFSYNSFRGSAAGNQMLCCVWGVAQSDACLNVVWQYLRLGALQFGDIPISKEELEVRQHRAEPCFIISLPLCLPRVHCSYLHYLILGQVGEAKLKRAREVAQRAATRDQRRKELGRGLLNMR